jgi:hypothetical protein
MPESFQNGRDAFEVVTDEPNALLIRGEVGPRRLQRAIVTVDADEVRTRGCFEDRRCVSAESQSSVDEDAPMLQRRDEDLDDLSE